MRKDDHQMHFDMQALLVSEKTEQSIMYRGQDFDMSYVNVGNISMEDITLDTTCKMKRPNRVLNVFRSITVYHF